MEEKFYVTISREGRTQKPIVGEEEQYILSKMPPIGLSAEDIAGFADTIGNHGHSFYPGIFANRWITKKNFLKGYLLVADIDNSSGNQSLTPEQALDRLEEYGLDCNIIYLTLRDPTPPHLSDNEILKIAKKFRMVFILERPIDNAGLYEALLKEVLYRLFPESDRLSIKHFYYGGKKLIYINSDFRLSPLRLFNAAHAYDTRNITRTQSRSRNFKKMLGDLSPNDYNQGVSLSFDSKTTTCNSIHIQPVKNELKVIRNFDWEGVRTECNLLDEFIGVKRKVVHNELFGLYTSMKRIEGGRKLWRESVRSNPEISNDKIIEIAKWIDDHDKVSGYIWEQNLSSYAPYDPAAFKYERLTDIQFNRRHEARKLSGAKIHEIPLNSAEAAWKYYFHEVKSELGTGTYVFKCATGIGKTEILMNINLSECIIATPTHVLKDELSERLTKAGVEHNVFPELPELPALIQKKYDAYISVGAFDQAAGFLRSLILCKTNNYGVAFSEEKELKKTIINYFATIDRITTETTPILTTHKRIIHTEFPIHSCIIVDEDILKTVGETKSIGMKAIRASLQKLNAEDEVKELWEELLEYSKDPKMIGLIFSLEQIFDSLGTTAKLGQSIIDKMINLGIKDDMISMMRAEHFVIVPNDFRDPDGEKDIHFIVRNELPKDKKVIILSATANTFMYENLFKEVEFFDLSVVEMVGKGIQYSNRGLSRSSFFSENTKKQILKISDYLGDKIVITYKGNHYQEYFKRPFRHLENIEGTDELKGKDIAVIGTPNKPYYFYWLWASLLKFDYNENESILKEQIVETNEYQFMFMTFDNLNLRKIQFHFIESALMQAVGRARLIREPATVEVFSNFPLVGFEQRHLRDLPQSEITNGLLKLDRGNEGQIITLTAVSGSIAS